MSAVGVLSATILANQSISEGVDLGTNQLFALEIPTTFNATTLTFQAKSKGSNDLGDDNPEDQETWRNVYDTSGTEISVTVAAGRMVVPTAAIASALAPLRYIRIRVGTSAAPVNINPGAVVKVITKLA